MALTERWTKERVRAAAGTALLEAVLGYALIVGLGVPAPAPVREELKRFGMLAEPPPPPPKREVEPPPKPVPEPEGAASPPNLKAVPTEIVRPPPPVVRLPPPPPPVATAPVAGPGAASSAGAAETAGPGTGAGGQGNGFGAGRGGGGGGSGVAAPARFLRGELRNRDYPRELGDRGVGGTVVARFVVEADGRVSHCRVIRSSGNAELDDITCEMIERRYRYAPARDADGRPIASVDTDEHEWVSRAPVPVDDD
ncbi:MAG: energy transducer TonB [Allosphingosinicella sp.]